MKYTVIFCTAILLLMPLNVSFAAILYPMILELDKG